MRLLLLGTAGCHLCEEAEEIIRECLPNDYQQVVETIDIAEQEHWQAQYAIRIPVLYHPATQKELAWRFEVGDVERFIRSL
ncbi:MAG: glutaredoxin family protein [Methylococcales bacterium]|nr:glutaredoxin family protein [Methylococcales bacterium]